MGDDDPKGVATLGFACLWDRDPRTTWSGTPWHLRAAIRRLGDGPAVVDAGLDVPSALRTAMRAVSARRSRGRWIARWEHWPVWRRAAERRIRARARREGCDAVLEIGDLAVVDRPYFVYQDLSALLVAEDRMRAGREEFFRLLDTPARVARRIAWQRHVYGNATGVFAMSRWLADHLVEHEGIPRRAVHVVPPGATSLAGAGPLPARPADAPRRRLLFLGTEFRTKGGDQVVAALRVLRREVDPRITLTVAGPRSWPLPGAPPAGVTFLGRVPRERVVSLIDAHDVFVMPSRLEGFGIAFVEALGRGVPCVGRRACAMPEIIDDGETGALVEGDDPSDLAEIVARVLADDRVHAQARARAAEVAGFFTWDRAAADMVRAIEASSSG